MTDKEEFIADINPCNSASIFCIDGVSIGNSCSVVFTGLAGRVNSLDTALENDS
jgi:hypothetical protein